MELVVVVKVVDDVVLVLVVDVVLVLVVDVVVLLDVEPCLPAGEARARAKVVRRTRRVLGAIVV